MKVFLTVLAFCITGILAGCKPADSRQPNVGADATNTATVSTKDQFIASMRAKLDALDAQMNELGTKLQNGSEKVKAEAQPKVDALKAKISSLGEELKNAKDSVTWEDFKAGFEKSSEDAKESVTQARQWLSEKIAPAASTN